MTKQEEQEQNKQFALVNEVAATVNIVDVRLASFSSSHDPVSENEPLMVGFKCKAGASVEGTSEPKIVVLADFLMEARPEGSDESAEPRCEIRAQIILTYESPKATAFSDDHLAAFAQANGIYNAWPYWREFVQNSTVRMGLPALIVPSLGPDLVSHQTPEADSKSPIVDDENNHQE